MKKILMVVLVLMMIPIVSAKTYTKSECKSYAYKQVIKRGWSKQDYNNLVKLYQKESGWNAKAVNKYSKACGLGQAYPCNKMRKYGKDYKTNCKVQINWGLDYIKNRYKTPSKAWSFWQKKHWY